MPAAAAATDAPGAAAAGPADMLDAPLDCFLRSAPATVRKFQRLGLNTARDLLFHFPLRYVDKTRIVPICQLLPGQEALVEGTVRHSEIRWRPRKSLVVCLEDDTGLLQLRFLHFARSQQQRFRDGAVVRCYGSVRHGAFSLEMVHPECMTSRANRPMPLKTQLTPIYPSGGNLSQASLRRAIGSALERVSGDRRLQEELLPERVLGNGALPRFRDALQFVHLPPPGADTDALRERQHPAFRRLAFEELLAHHMALMRVRAKMRARKGLSLRGDEAAIRRFVASLPFALTSAQQRVIGEIRQDLQREVPMMRLLQGDVGSGKTAVAAVAALEAASSGRQACVMVPTELLAAQHYERFSQWFGELGIPVLLLTGRLTRARRKSLLGRLRDGGATLIVGTHALLQEEVAIPDLGLAIIDEQHRFGVYQRLNLLNKGAEDARHPHQLVMTATPIPRTFSMAIYADLDLSVIDRMPPGRQPANTAVVSCRRREELALRIAAACDRGRQAYWICSLIEETEKIGKRSAIRTREYLARSLPGLRIGLIHGRMRPAEKDAVMQEFVQGGLQVLVATTVIEVGIDVPNASLMIVENSERLGLAQLHQLRGRIGRGSTRGDCILLYEPPLSQVARERLMTMRDTQDGFKIAECDLRLRGPGELLGTRQKGLPQMRIADLYRDRMLLPEVRAAARDLLEEHPERIPPLLYRWQGGRPEYGGA